MRIKRLRLKQKQRTNFSETTKVQKLFKDTFKNKIKNIEKKDDLLKTHLLMYKKERDYLKKD